MKRIKSSTSNEDVIFILTDLLNRYGSFDSVELIDTLEQIKHPLVTHNSNGDRKLNPKVIKTLRKTFILEFDNSDKCWYKKSK